MSEQNPQIAAEREALIISADAAFDDRKYETALAMYASVAGLAPDDIEARTGIALCLVHLRRDEEAIPLLIDLEQLMPESDQLQFILGEALCRTGRLREAEERLTRLIARNPSNADAHTQLGRLFMDQDRNREANDSLAAALQVDPEHVEALTLMGVLMIKFCQFDDALTALQRALARKPENALVLNNLGRARKMMGQHEEALAWFRRALELEPSSTCVIDNYLFALNYCAEIDPDFIAAEHCRLACHYSDPGIPAAPRREAVSDRPLKIGYISADFYTHSVTYFLEPILQNHDYRRFEIYCYSTGATEDETTGRLKSFPCVWRSMHCSSPAEIASRVREDGIDILVDLSGHTANNRLAIFAARSAPVQVTWTGYPNTTGLPAMDYFLTDALCDPPGMTDRLYSERLWRLPRTFCCYLPPMEFPPITASPADENGFITFGSFNNFAKVTEQQLRLWGRILANVPGSRLYLKSMALGDRSVKESVLRTFRSEGVDPERVTMRTVTKTPLEHLQEYARVDIALDTYPYHGTTTTCEALWMGTPVITMAGRTHVSRVGVSILSQIGCSQWVADNEEDYVRLAVSLAADRLGLEAWRVQLREKMAKSPLMDAAGVTKEVEEAFTEMFRRTSERSRG